MYTHSVRYTQTQRHSLHAQRTFLAILQSSLNKLIFCTFIRYLKFFMYAMVSEANPICCLIFSVQGGYHFSCLKTSVQRVILVLKVPGWI